MAVHKRIDLIVGTFGSNSNPINRSLNPYSNAACIGRDPSTHKRRTLARDDLGSAPSIQQHDDARKASCSFKFMDEVCADTEALADNAITPRAHCCIGLSIRFRRSVTSIRAI